MGNLLAKNNSNDNNQRIKGDYVAIQNLWRLENFIAIFPIKFAWESTKKVSNEKFFVFSIFIGPKMAIILY